MAQSAIRKPGGYTRRHFLGAALLIAATLLPLPAFAQDDNPGMQTAPEISTSTPLESASPAPATADDSQQPLQSESASASNTIHNQAAVSDAVDTTLIEPSPNTATISIDNTITAGSSSGTANVQDNIEAGNATSGQSATAATVVNIANAGGLQANRLQSFECNLYDDYQGNLLIDPASLLPICSATTPDSPQTTNTSSSLQTGSSLVNLLNTIVLDATSGDASVKDNISGGSATSGDALALANVINIANTAINADRSFIGVINIYSELKGDILVPSSLVDSLIGDRGPAGHSAAAQTSTAINNNLTASANSGQATVTDNIAAGDATSGDAATSVTILNLTGQQIVAKNSLLVFVNVLGKWMGLVVPAPGSKTAILGSGVQSGPINTSAAWHSDGSTTTSVTNDITVRARSGNATVSGNTEAGSATSGKAMAGINLLNITDSQFLLDDWFGALFINVLGSWLGDFDIQSSAATSTSADPDKPSAPIQDVRVFQLQQPVTVSRTTASSNNATAYQPANTAAAETPTETTAAVLGAGTTQSPATDNQVQSTDSWQTILLAAGIAASLALLIASIPLLRRVAKP